MTEHDGTRFISALDAAPSGWDERAVDVPGGHALQSVAWAEYRRTRGVVPRYVSLDDDSVALVSTRRSPGLPGSEAVIRRGPAQRDDSATTAMARVAAITDWAATDGARDVFLDPERDRDPAWDAAMDAAGFEIADELEPSIHVMRLAFGDGADEEGLWSGLSKSARQRIRSARSSETVIDSDDAGDRLPQFVDLLRERADVLGIALAADDGFIAGWRSLLTAGHARFLTALHEDELVGGLFLYRHGGVHATAFSADAAARRRELPGTMHLLRWQAIADALDDGASTIDLGGVDLPGRRTPPEKGDPARGLYEHKRSFGAVWVDRSPARRRVLRPWAVRLGELRRSAVDVARRMRR
jgi:lipid II:glycine glycyltransferase (peptidoglycan interpeptide bridge formation enzyme)